MKGYMQESFFQVPMETGETSEGSVEFPILYFDSSCVTAFFRCDIDRIENQLAGLPLKAGLVMGKQAVAGISFYEYRETSIGPYNEVGVAIPVIFLAPIVNSLVVNSYSTVLAMNNCNTFDALIYLK